MPSFLPKAIYVKFDNFDLNLIQPIPCEEHQVIGADHKCSDCQFFTGVAATWVFNQKLAKDLPNVKLNIESIQFPLAPALPKTVHTLQGATCEPGLVCHLTLPKSLSCESRWLLYYVMLSRVRRLQSLRCIGAFDKKYWKEGRQKECKLWLTSCSTKRKKDTEKACAEARAFLSWPSRP